MDTDRDSKPLAPKRKTRNTKCNSLKNDSHFEEKSDKHKESEDHNQRENIVPATEKGTNQDSGDVDKEVPKHNQDSATTSPNMKDHISCMPGCKESDKSNICPPGNDSLVNKQTCTADTIVVAIGDSLKNLSEKKCAFTAEEVSGYLERTCPNSAQVETAGDLSDSPSHPKDLEHRTTEDDGNKSCDEGGKTEDYPESLNPFADSTSDQDDSSETPDSCTGFNDALDAEHGPVRTTAKARPSLYPWRPFAVETIPYKSHMIPNRQTAKKRASLYPWRPFGEQDYPEELNPFSEIVQNDTKDEHDDRHLNKVLEEDSKYTNSEQRFAIHTPSQEKYQTSAQEIEEEEEDVPSETEDEDVGVGKSKKIGRGTKFLKTVRRKFRKFLDCVFRR